MSDHAIPASQEVLTEQILRCPCATCTMYRKAHEAIESGTPERRRELFEAVTSIGWMLLAAVAKDMRS